MFLALTKRKADSGDENGVRLGPTQQVGSYFDQLVLKIIITFKFYALVDEQSDQTKLKNHAIVYRMFNLYLNLTLSFRCTKTERGCATRFGQNPSIMKPATIVW